MNGSLDSRAVADTAKTPRPQALPRPATALRQRLAELRGPTAVPHPLDARALAALAANPGCRRRALLDGAGVDKAALARALGAPATFGQSQFAFMRGNAFEARIRADDGAELLRLLCERLGEPSADEALVPDLSAAGPEGRAARTRLALAEATSAGHWSLLFHPMVVLDVAGSSAYLEPDAVVVHPDGSWTVVEVKSFPVVDGAADPAKVGAAARQAAVYVLALERLAGTVGSTAHGTAAAREPTAAPVVPEPLAEGDSRADGGGTVATGSVAARVRHTVLLVCPKDFSNLPTAEPVDVRKQLSVTRRQLARLTRIEEIATAVPEGTTFDLRLADDGRTPTRPAAELVAAVESVGATYTPECLAACELAFHCRGRARAAGAVETLGRAARGELGGLTTVQAALAAAFGETGPGPVNTADRDARPRDHPAPDDPAVDALRRAAALRAEALIGSVAHGSSPCEPHGPPATAGEGPPGLPRAAAHRTGPEVACR
ncbi:hypothetical protein [Streptomyces sp. KR80]|uniref:hypothetical protein n=1 Tax=Streptomyces sp. KR80 TaxID=3457426 RepID=UPI003FD0D253